MGGKSDNTVADTELQKELARISVQQYQRYQKEFVPVENQAIANALDVEGMEAELGGMANADQYQAFGEGQKTIIPGLATAGGNLNTGRAVLGLGGYNENQSFALGQGLVQSDLASQGTYARNASNLVAMGQGRANEGLQGLAENASAAQRQAFMDQRASAASQAATANILGSAVGMGAGFYADRGMTRTLGSGLKTPGVTGDTYSMQA